MKKLIISAAICAAFLPYQAFAQSGNSAEISVKAEESKSTAPRIAEGRNEKLKNTASNKKAQIEKREKLSKEAKRERAMQRAKKRREARKQRMENLPADKKAQIQAERKRHRGEIRKIVGDHKYTGNKAKRVEARGGKVERVEARGERAKRAGPRADGSKILNRPNQNHKNTRNFQAKPDQAIKNRAKAKNQEGVNRAKARKQEGVNRAPNPRANNSGQTERDLSVEEGR
jgi:hypothetical protein